MKRIFRWMVVLTIILWSVQSKSLPAVGTETHMVLDENVIGVQYLYIETYRDHFEISSTGAASCTTIASGDNVDALHVYGSLQKEISGQWISIGSWSKKVNGTEAKITNTVTVGPGKYRYKSSVYLYRNGMLVEQDDKASNPISY
ncbi:hypothetical protein [Proteiniclasticum ruminis]|uniref:Uncharacterized protein n=1 Tax=Proteiniclasticum ruminis TaxID=398199 RepID=A0A1G8H9B6_9CLOT|nr:hypothetical protein [Proteiniclasticum ruminis]SDI03081.1 hypothetical protein SAMN05421804_101510 [Proteiniclasticum ruminis]